jgi:AcrR family transcriptional regulator
MPKTLATRRTANRRRRTEAKDQILKAARHELETKPFRDLSVDDLMSATGFGRTAFYRYFPDREAVLIELLEDLWEDLRQARDAAGFGASGSVATDENALGRLQGFVAENRTLFKAIADAAGGDADVEEAYRALMHDYWIRDLLALLTEAHERGTAIDLDPELAAEALGWMAERFVTQSLDRDPEVVIATIVAIGAKCISGTSPPRPATG